LLAAMRAFQSILLPVHEAEALVGPFRRGGDWSRVHGIPAHMTLAGPWPLSIELRASDLALVAEKIDGQRYALSTVDVLGDAVCLFPDDDAPLMCWRSRLLDLVGAPDEVDKEWRVHLTVCRGLDLGRADEVLQTLGAMLPLPCVAPGLLLAQMLSPSEVIVRDARA
jgi:hypothetical protein